MLGPNKGDSTFSYEEKLGSKDKSSLLTNTKWLTSTVSSEQQFGQQAQIRSVGSLRAGGLLSAKSQQRQPKRPRRTTTSRFGQTYCAATESPKCTSPTLEWARADDPIWTEGLLLRANFEPRGLFEGCDDACARD